MRYRGMYIRPKTLFVCSLISLLIACSESDSGSSTPGKTATPAATPAPAASASKDSMMAPAMENDVIYQDEIYKNWPYQ